MTVKSGFKFDASGPIELFSNALPRNLIPALKRGAGSAAYEIQQMMRSELDRLIYDTPESPNYRRTYTLRRSTYASRPGGNHEHDHDAAKAGHDLAVTRPVAGGVVRVSGFVAEIEIGSWANYAWHVHEGHGFNRTARPFSVRPIEAAPNIVEKEIGSAIAEYILRTVK